MRYCTLLVVCVLLLLSTVQSESNRSSEHEGKQTVTHPKKNVIERGLVTDKATAKSILKENERYSSEVHHRNFIEGDDSDGAMVLAYVTPWNNHGYDIAKIFNSKFTHVSPVWYQIKMDDAKAHLTGQHDVDQGWINDVKANKKTKMVPRFLVELRTAEQYSALFQSQSHVFKLLLDECVKQKVDGLVLDGMVPIMSSPNSDAYVHSFVKGLAAVLHEANLEFIFVIPPKQGDRVAFGREDFEALAPSVDGFSLMSYDYSNMNSPGPTSPIGWVQDCVSELLTHESYEAGLGKKILLGLNFYGYDYSLHKPHKGGSIVGKTYIQLLQEHKPKLTWDSHVKEHVIMYEDKQDDHKVYFPTLKSINERIKAAKRLGVSLSIWEIGQGLDYFYDLL